METKKEMYLEPNLEVICLSLEDIMTASNNDNTLEEDFFD